MRLYVKLCEHYGHAKFDERTLRYRSQSTTQIMWTPDHFYTAWTRESTTEIIWADLKKIVQGEWPILQTWYDNDLISSPRPTPNNNNNNKMTIKTRKIATKKGKEETIPLSASIYLHETRAPSHYFQPRSWFQHLSTAWRAVSAIQSETRHFTGKGIAQGQPFRPRHLSSLRITPAAGRWRDFLSVCGDGVLSTDRDPAQGINTWSQKNDAFWKRVWIICVNRCSEDCILYGTRGIEKERKEQSFARLRCALKRSYGSFNAMCTWSVFYG